MNDEKPFDGTYPNPQRDPKINLRGSKPAVGTKEYEVWDAENTAYTKEMKKIWEQYEKK